MDEGGSSNGVLLSEGAKCGGTVGRVPFLGTLDGMLRKALDRGPFIFSGNLESGFLGLLYRGPFGVETGDLI